MEASVNTKNCQSLVCGITGIATEPDISEEMLTFYLGSEGAKNLKARFENMAAQQETEARKQAELVKKQRKATENQEHEEQHAREKVLPVTFLIH